jgi:signal transduction histidine kinase
MSMAAKPSKPVSRRRSPDRPAERASRIAKAGTAGTRTRRHSSTEARQTIEAIRAGLVDALVIQGDDSDRLYALRTFTEIERTQAALKNAGAARRRSDAQLKALAEERERLFQDMHDGCIQSIYAATLNLEASRGLIEVNPQLASKMIAEATASLNLVILELRSFITGQKLQLASGRNLRTELEKAVQAAGNQGLSFTIDIDENAMKALTSEQAFHLLQIAREGISNATRHAKARTGRVSLQQRDRMICLEVSDDGSGFIAKKMNKLGLGLHHIDARARKLGGTVQVNSTPNLGTRIVVQFGKRLIVSKGQ